MAITRIQRSHGVGPAMLRLAGLDELGMDLDEAWLRCELGQLLAARWESGDGKNDAAAGTVAGAVLAARGCVARTRGALVDYALLRASMALCDAERRGGQL
jgi:hypothetical protein